MNTDKEESTLENRKKHRDFRQKMTPLWLLSPSVILMIAIFVISMGMLFINSAYHFTGLKIEKTLTFDAWPKFFTDPFYWNLVYRTLRLGAIITFLTVVIGYPTAYAVTRIKNPRLKFFFFILIFSPLLTSVVIRSFGWLILLGDFGLINYVLEGLGLIQEPIKLVYNALGVKISLTHVLLPFAVFPMFSVLTQIDPTLKEAANDLGANRWVTFWKVTWPMSLSGVISGTQITFILAVGAYATPQILGGGRVMVLPAQIYESIVVLDWPMAAVQAIVLLMITLTIVFVFNRLVGLTYQEPQIGEL